MIIKLLIGLGNPSDEYKNNRHNSGFLFLDFLKDKSEIQTHRNIHWTTDIKHQSILCRGENYLCVKPQTYMNLSGVSVSSLMSYYKIKTDDIIVFHDDLDIALGKYKIEFGHGPKMHNGITSIEQSIHTQDFWRVRIGIDARNSENKIKGIDYVLQNFSNEERVILNDTFSILLENIINKKIINW